jgi:lipid-binding SYLF domain-containing protein
MIRSFRALLPGLAALVALTGLATLPAPARADQYADTVQLFKNAGQSGTFFDKAYGYAVFPTVGKGALGIGGARGKGRVYAQGRYTGDTTLTQLSIGFQAGGQAYSQIVFFEDERAYREFTSGEFGFGAGVSAVAITAAASATASTTGNSAGVSGGKKDATTTGEYYKGMAVFTIAKGGLMYEAALAGQKFSYRAKPAQ